MKELTFLTFLSVSLAFGESQLPNEVDQVTVSALTDLAAELESSSDATKVDFLKSVLAKIQALQDRNKELEAELKPLTQKQKVLNDQIDERTTYGGLYGAAFGMFAVAAIATIRELGGSDSDKTTCAESLGNIVGISATFGFMTGIATGAGGAGISNEYAEQELETLMSPLKKKIDKLKKEFSSNETEIETLRATIRAMGGSTE